MTCTPIDLRELPVRKIWTVLSVGRLLCPAVAFYSALLVLVIGPVLAQTTMRPSQGGLLDADNASGSQIGIQYEQWFYGPQSWKTAEAIPLLGKYTTDEATVAKHYAEFHELGIDWLLIDWSNMPWSNPAWEELGKLCAGC